MEINSLALKWTFAKKLSSKIITSHVNKTRWNILRLRDSTLYVCRLLVSFSVRGTNEWN